MTTPGPTGRQSPGPSRFVLEPLSAAGYKPNADRRDWLIAGAFAAADEQRRTMCEGLIQELAGIFGPRAVEAWHPPGLRGALILVIVRPDENIRQYLTAAPGAVTANTYEAAVLPYVEAYWNDLTLIGRIRLVEGIGAPPDCVMQAQCPAELHAAIEGIITT